MFKELWLSLKRWIYVRHSLRYVGLYRPNKPGYNPTTFIILTGDLVLIQDHWLTYKPNRVFSIKEWSNINERQRYYFGYLSTIAFPKERRGILV